MRLTQTGYFHANIYRTSQPASQVNACTYQAGSFSIIFINKNVCFMIGRIQSKVQLYDVIDIQVNTYLGTRNFVVYDCIVNLEQLLECREDILNQPFHNFVPYNQYKLKYKRFGNRYHYLICFTIVHPVIDMNNPSFML